MKQLNEPAVLVFDLEITLNTGVLKAVQLLGADERAVVKSMNAIISHITCVSYMWLGSGKVETISLKDFPKLYCKNPSDDSQLLIAFSKVINKADYTVAHYGEKFDIPFLNTRIEKSNLPSLSPSKLRDTWRIMRSKFKLPNNRLDTALKFFESPIQKPPLDWDCWRKVSLGDKKAFGPMIQRCEADTKSLEWLYREKLRKYDNQGPDYTKYSEDRVCRYCGGKNVINDRHLVGGKMLVRCKDCTKYTKIKETIVQ